MDNFKKTNHCSWKCAFKTSYIKEKRFVFDEDEPGMWDGIASMWNGAGKLFNAAGNLVDFTTGVAGDAVTFVQKSYGQAAGLIEIGLDKFNPDPPDFNDKELKRDLPGLGFPAVNTGDAEVDEIAVLHTGVCFYAYKIAEYKEYYDPMLTTYKKIEDDLNQIESNKVLTYSRKKELEKSIKDSETVLPSLRKTDPRKQIAETQIQMDKQELKSIEAMTSYEMVMPVPQIVESEYPPGSGKYLRRFVLGNTNENVDLRSLYKYLSAQIELNELNPSMLNPFAKESKLEIYDRKIKEFTFARDNAIDEYITNAGGISSLFSHTAKKDLWEKRRDAITAHEEALEQGLGNFATRGTATPVYFALRRSVSTLPPPVPSPAALDVDRLDSMRGTLPP